MILPSPPLLVISDRSAGARDLVAVLAAALAGGCRWVMLREKDLPGAAQAALARRVVALARPFGATVLVNGDLAAVRGCGVDGAHLPRGGAPAAARAVLGAGALVGVSAHSLEEARAAAAGGANYVTVSPVFASAGKPGYGPALGLPALRAIAGAVALPVLALGGIDAANAGACRAAGAAGVAVMGAVMRAADPAAAVRRLIDDAFAA